MEPLCNYTAIWGFLQHVNGGFQQLLQLLAPPIKSFDYAHTHTHSNFQASIKHNRHMNTHFSTQSWRWLRSVQGSLWNSWYPSVVAAPLACAALTGHTAALLQLIHESCCSYTAFRVKLDWWQAVCVLQPLTWMSLQRGLWLTRPWLGSSGSWFWCWSPYCSGSASVATAGTRVHRHHWRSIWQVRATPNLLLCGWMEASFKHTRTSTLVLL